jgi:hypothetical protein
MNYKYLQKWINNKDGRKFTGAENCPNKWRATMRLTVSNSPEIKFLLRQVHIHRVVHIQLNKAFI